MVSAPLWEVGTKAALPVASDVDLLIVMGGPMSVHDETEYRWLPAEKQLIGTALDAGRFVLGICLGAQLIAEVLGATVAPMGFREIGWFPVRRSDVIAAAATGLAGTLGRALPPRFDAFHWHGDTFTIPPGAYPIGASDACPSQGFLWRDRALALQFHLETTAESARALVENCGDEIDGGGRYVQSRETIAAEAARFAGANRLMETIWNAIEQVVSPG